MIGVVVSDVENSHFTQLVRAIEAAAYQQGYRVLLCNTDDTVEKQRSYLEILAAERVSGVMLSATDPASQEIGKMLDLGIPVVAFDRTVEDPRADTVTPDNLAGGHLATEHLIERGHKKIAFVSGLARIQTAEERLAGYVMAMRAAGFEPYSVDGKFTIEGGCAATAEMLKSSYAPTAVVVANNMMMIGVLQMLRSNNVRVPEDLALVLIDDPFWSELVEPQLTALAQPIQEMAACALRLLLERLSGQRQEARHFIFDFELRVRGSSGTFRTK